MNNWANPTRASAQEAAEIAALLEERVLSLDQIQVNIEYLNVLHQASGEHLLEVGCGIDVFCRLKAPQVISGEKITGLDISAEFVKGERQPLTLAE